jgi:hypothetical protein
MGRDTKNAQNDDARGSLEDSGVGAVAPLGQLLVSQQDYETEWVRIPWPPEEPIELRCMNPNCSSRGFPWERLEASVSKALGSGSLVAGSLRCEGMDTVAMRECSNALVYLWDDGEDF